MADPLVEQTDPTAGSLSPTSDEPLSPEQEIAAIEEAILGTNVDIQQPLVDADPTEALPPFGRSFAFDPFARLFLTSDGAHGPRETRGLETLLWWIEKALATEQGTSPIHSDSYGLQGMDDFIGSYADGLPPRPARVRAALTFHPRIADVRNYSLSHADPQSNVVDESFEAVLDDGTVVPVFRNLLTRTGDG